jgi:hypothetical protein
MSTASNSIQNGGQNAREEQDDFEELEADLGFYDEDLKKPIEIQCNEKTANIIKSFLVGYFTNLCFYSGNPNLGYTLLRDQ